MATATKTKKVKTFKLKPVLKWAGGKHRSNTGVRINELYNAYKYRFPTVVLPFCGALGTFFKVLPDECLANDANPHLIGLYQYLKHGGTLAEYPKINDHETYYNARDRFNCLKKFRTNVINGTIEHAKESITLLKPYINHPNIEILLELNEDELLKQFELESRGEDYYKLDYLTQCLFDLIGVVEQQVFTDLIWLNKACVNGLYRLNKKKAEFNVPKGSTRRPSCVSNDDLHHYRNALKRIEFQSGDFSTVLQNEFLNGKSAFIYCDPPYIDTFSGYHENSFSLEDFERLLQFGEQCYSRDFFFVMSNSYSADLETRLKKAGYLTETVIVRRSVSCDPDGRTDVKEIVAYKCPY